MTTQPAAAGGDAHARPLHRRRPVVGLVAAGTALVALVGLLVWTARPPESDLTAVREAVEALLVAPAVRVRNGSVDGTVRADLLVVATDLGADGARKVYDDVEAEVPELVEAADGSPPLSSPTRPVLHCGLEGCSLRMSVLVSPSTSRSGTALPGAAPPERAAAIAATAPGNTAQWPVSAALYPATTDLPLLAECRP
jgi:hypothetical protein